MSQYSPTTDAIAPITPTIIQTETPDDVFCTTSPVVTVMPEADVAALWFDADIPILFLSQEKHNHQAERQDARADE